MSVRNLGITGETIAKWRLPNKDLFQNPDGTIDRKAYGAAVYDAAAEEIRKIMEAAQ